MTIILYSTKPNKDNDELTMKRLSVVIVKTNSYKKVYTLGLWQYLEHKFQEL